MKLSKKRLEKLQKDESLILLAKCRRCGEEIEIRSEKNMQYCECGANIVFMYNLNYLNLEIIYKKEELLGSNLKNYNRNKYNK